MSEEKPPAMPDAASYAATRLREIKADPDTWSDVWRWRREFSAADTPALRREVLGLARQIGPEPFLAILAQALAADDPLVRLDAARSIALLPDERMADGLAIGVAAPDAGTRSEVMDLIDQVQPHLRPPLLRAALLAADAAVQERAIAMLNERPSPECFAVLLEGLRTTTGETRTTLESAVAGVCGETLREYAPATRWWSANRERFDDLMSRVR
jgi:HEAT repeat protein